ncbi:MAG: hypothetical protein IKU42_05430 [Oscillospiraceae bacterium]|nr:hypothetical protein [Oscillospiraceae bacterium]
MTKKYKIDHNKRIGNVIFVVEGGRPDTGGTELRLLKSIFSDILHYEIQELRRGTDEFKGYRNNPFCKVFALNVPKNQLTELTDSDLDILFARLKEEFKLKPEDCPIYFLYDRDYLSYKPNELRGKFVKKYTDPYANDDGSQGQLLLSYPAVESFLLSCIKENIFQSKYFLGKDLKPIVQQENFSENDVKTDTHLIHAATEMDKCLSNFSIQQYDLDNLGPTLLEIYDKQQTLVSTERSFSLLSLISMVLLELGIIVEDDTEN